MPQIDTLLSQLQRSGATVAVLRGDAPLQFSGGEASGPSQGATLSNARVEEFLSEILPPDARSALELNNIADFNYASPLGICRVQVRRSGGITALKISPSFASAPSFAPQTPSLHPTPQNTLPQPIAPPPIAPPPIGPPPIGPMGMMSPAPAPALQANNSGQPSATLPAELRGFNWGGLLLSWVWAIGNQSWIGLLGLIPGIGFFVRFLLGAKGNEMAWRNRKWQSVEQFRSTQRMWTIAGVCVFLFSIPLMAAVLFPVFARARENARRAACQQNMKQIALGARQYSFDHKGKFPSGTTMASWKIALKPYAADSDSNALWVCPGVKSGEESYLLNPKMAGANVVMSDDSPNIPLFYDAEIRHLDGVNVAFADGHIKWYRDEVFESQILPQLMK